MTSSELKNDLATRAGAIGLLIDRSGDEEQILGSVWLIDSNKVATCAHLITLYGDKLNALKVFFPAVNQSHGISQALFHPKFNRKYSAKLASDGLWDSLSNMHLQNFNAVVLTLTPQLAPLSDREKQLANQSLTVAAPQIEQGLGGNLADIDFYLVLQTITNARKEGVVIISDTRNRPVARLFCQNGRIAHAIFKNLNNELAVYQMVQSHLKGNFFFQVKSEPDWPVERPIARPPEMLLLEAHRRMDEMERFLGALGGPDSFYVRAVPWMNDGILPAEVAETARNLWPHLDGTLPIASLWQVVNVDNYAVYNALIELFKTRQIENVDDTTEFSPPSPGPLKVEPLDLVPQIELIPGDPIENLSVDHRRGHPRIRSGFLLGSLLSDDPYHLLHNIPLLPESCGSPMFKKGVVIGLHCGALPPAPELDENEGAMQQMLWSELIIECLEDGGEVELAKRLSSTGVEIAKNLSLSGVYVSGGYSLETGERISDGKDSKTLLGFGASVTGDFDSADAGATTDIPSLTASSASTGATAATGTAAVHRPTQAGCREVARVHCSKCGKTSLDAARFCKSCGQRLFQDVQYKPPKRVFTQAPLVVTTMCFFAAVIIALILISPVKPQYITTHLSYIPDEPWVRVNIFGVNKLAHEAPQWRPIPDGAELNDNVQVYLDMKANQDCYMYVLSDLPKGKAGGDQAKGDQANAQANAPDAQANAAIEFPEPKTPEKMLKKGEHFTVPKETIKEGMFNGVKGLFLNGLTTGAGDTTILIASSKPLPLPGNQENANVFFENANRILSLDRFSRGIEVPISQVAPNLFPPDVNDRPGDLIYLKRLMEKIPTD
ncbi:MAG: DUF4388 domain-containing protein [Candidatus Melainabacteria bacterium]|nr:MAG: DUF4388 domain-containing protein [Candidatus Melainabacteria bacterium]